jgi:hypothetical protein
MVIDASGMQSLVARATRQLPVAREAALGLLIERNVEAAAMRST